MEVDAQLDQAVGPLENLATLSIERPKDVCVIDVQWGASKDVSYTWSDFYDLVCRADHFLRAQGCTPDDKIMLSCKSQVLTLACALACLKAAIPFSLLSPHLRAVQKKSILREMGTRFCVSDCKPLASLNWKSVDLTLKDLTAYEYTERTRPHVEDGNIAFVALGSGTTGKPKHMAFSYGDIVRRTAWRNSHLSLSDQSCAASTVPVSFVSSFFRALYPLAGGYALVLGLSDAKHFADVVERYGITHLASPVLHMEQVVTRFGARRKASFASVQELSVAYSTVREELLQSVRDCITQNVFNAYGSSEVSGATRLPPHTTNRVKGSVGFALPGAVVEVVDRDDQPVAHGDVGLVRLKTPCMLHAYANPSIADSANFRDGWFYPGDIGRLTLDGQLVHLGRSDHMMIYNGINIYPAEIEQVLSAHPAVKDVAVMPFAHKIHQEVPACVVSLHAGQVLEEGALRDYARDRLGGAAPRLLFITPEVPRSAQGKLVRPALKDLFRAQIKAGSVAGRAPTA